MSKDKILFVLFLVLSMTITGCSLFESQETDGGSVSSTTSGNAELDNMLADVTARYNALAKSGGAWSSSEESLDKATESVKKKDFEKAMKLLKEVNDEIELARAQFEQEKNAKPHLF